MGENNLGLPVVSVCVTSYNAFSYLLDAVDSVLKQDYPQIELIIADDHSDDWSDFEPELWASINARKRYNIVKIIITRTDQNLGTVRNINHGLSYASGKYVKILNGDDMFYDSGSLLTLVRYSESRCLRAVCATGYVMTENKRILKMRPRAYIHRLFDRMSNKLLLNLMCVRCILFAPGFMFERSLLTELGLFDEAYVMTDDYPAWFTILDLGIKIGFLETPVVLYRLGGVTALTKPVSHKQKVYFKDLRLVIKKEAWSRNKGLGILGGLIIEVYIFIRTVCGFIIK